MTQLIPSTNTTSTRPDPRSMPADWHRGQNEVWHAEVTDDDGAPRTIVDLLVQTAADDAARRFTDLLARLNNPGIEVPPDPDWPAGLREAYEETWGYDTTLGNRRDGLEKYDSAAIPIARGAGDEERLRQYGMRLRLTEREVLRFNAALDRLAVAIDKYTVSVKPEPIPNLSDEHRRYLADRGITDLKIIERRGYKTVERGLRIPMYRLPDGEYHGYEIRLNPDEA